MKRNDATERQVRAADPSGSVWLSANAGSGKTRVLTDRVARLLLNGVAPQHILCLTYTKAAATEMQNRLFERLGEWAMQDVKTLGENLNELGVEGGVDSDMIARARRLFARAIETPGGLKIQTIHSFCASLLRRFPVEAGVSPGFQEMDDRAAKLLRADILEEIADGPDHRVLDAVARRMSGDDLTRLTSEIATSRAAFDAPADWAAICEAFEIPPDLDEAGLLRIALDGSEQDIVHEVATVAAQTSSSYQNFAARLKALNLAAPDMSVLRVLFKEFLYQSGDKANTSKSVNFPQSNHTKAVDAFAPVADDLHAWMDRVADAKQAEFALNAARKTLALHDFARVFLPAYAEHKSRRGWLDFDDLILATRHLLTNPAVAQWVLFRLDGGIDHILVDEAQDTSPVQWDVIERLAQEFTSGEGARAGVERTIFVVGDKKQSIYSFQGADPEGFDRMRDLFQTRMQEAQQKMQPMTLSHSFRSAEPVLRLVDDTFRHRPVHGLGEAPEHIAFKDQMPGRVDLWPVIPKTEKPQDFEWFDPVDQLADDHHTVILAENIAAEIKAMIGTALIPDDNGMRKVRAGDFLILVQRRSDLFGELIRACKDAELDIAGADRLKVGAELAVKDITAVLAFLSTPEDDLSLAAALRSPLFGWSEAELHALAQPRPSKSYLWEALRKEESQALTILQDLRKNTDFLRPYDLIERLLTRRDGRRNLLARLGHEAEDGIDALLTLALQYESADVPSLTGFLSWLASDEVDIKRQIDSGQDQIRVMTVHGAKGLEAPIVILPDTATRKNKHQQDPQILRGDVAMWKPKSEEMPAPAQLALDAARAQRRAEEDRLLYVAMTRAEKWLIVAGAGDMDDEAWYTQVEQGMAHSGAVDHVFGDEVGKRLEHGDWGGAATDVKDPQSATAPVLPDWMETTAPAPTAPIKPLSPSDLGGAKALPGEGSDEETAKLRGTRIHLLLEHLLNHPREKWPDIARNFDIPDDVLAEATRVLTAPEFDIWFGPDTLAEVTLTADIPGLGPMLGTVDRLRVTDTEVSVLDFKSNRVVPDRPFETPEGILRQMGAYVAMLQMIYPHHHVGASVLWTADPCIMAYPNDQLLAALKRVTAP